MPDKALTSPTRVLHNPVLLDEVLSVLEPRDGAIYVDGTFGAGGYSSAILNQADCVVYAIDRDREAIANGSAMVKAFAGRLKLIEGRFSDLCQLLAARGVFKVDGVVLDVGVSSMQLDQAERGFSFMRDGPLDMRMSSQGLSAADVVNEFTPQQLKRIIAVYGEEKRAHSIAGAIARVREDEPFERTSQLAQLIEKTIGVPRHKKKTIHPATRTFQALRIFVNGELDELVRGLGAAEQVLAPGGVLAVVSFHSLEDRIVKKFFKKRTGSMPNPSRHQPLVDDGIAPSFTDLVKGGIKAGDSETSDNPRARSARLRAGMRTGAPVIDLDESELAQAIIRGV